MKAPLKRRRVSPRLQHSQATAGSSLGGPRTIVGVQVTNVGSDMGAITPMLAEIAHRTGQLPKTQLADANHAAHDCIRAATADGVTVLVAVTVLWRCRSGRDRRGARPTTIRPSWRGGPGWRRTRPSSAIERGPARASCRMHTCVSTTASTSSSSAVSRRSPASPSSARSPRTSCSTRAPSSGVTVPLGNVVRTWIVPRGTARSRPRGTARASSTWDRLIRPLDPVPRGTARSSARASSTWDL